MRGEYFGYTVCLFARLGFDAKSSEPPIIPHSSFISAGKCSCCHRFIRSITLLELCGSLLFNLWRIATSPFATLSQSILWHFLSMTVAYPGRILSARIRCCESCCVEHCVEHGEFLCFNTANASPQRRPSRRIFKSLFICVHVISLQCQCWGTPCHPNTRVLR